jgi:hypothetical protein
MGLVELFLFLLPAPQLCWKTGAAQKRPSLSPKKIQPAPRNAEGLPAVFAGDWRTQGVQAPTGTGLSSEPGLQAHLAQDLVAPALQFSKPSFIDAEPLAAPGTGGLDLQSACRPTPTRPRGSPNKAQCLFQSALPLLWVWALLERSGAQSPLSQSRTLRGNLRKALKLFSDKNIVRAPQLRLRE